MMKQKEILPSTGTITTKLTPFDETRQALEGRCKGWIKTSS